MGLDFNIVNGFGFLDGVDPTGTIAVMLIFGLPIVAILTNHQRKMAELIHGKGQSVDNQEVAMLRAEVAQLRDRVNQQTLMLDGVQRSLTTPPAMPDLQDRIG